MTTSEKGMALIKSFEGCQLTAYKCPAGIWTIGWGHTGGVKQGHTITKAEADKLLRQDLGRFERGVESYDHIYHWTQNEFDALVSFAYNVGSIDGITAKGTRTKAQIADKLLAYNKAGGKALAGLTRRRKAELELFLTPCTDSRISEHQAQLNASYGLHIAEDGIWGAETRKATWIGIQIELNADGAGLAVDGDPGPKTCAALAKATLRRGHQGNLVYLLQGLLLGLGYYSGALDGDFGALTEAAARNFQAEHGLLDDGVVGKLTWAKLAV